MGAAAPQREVWAPTQRLTGSPWTAAKPRVNTLTHVGRSSTREVARVPTVSCTLSTRQQWRLVPGFVRASPATPPLAFAPPRCHLRTPHDVQGNGARAVAHPTEFYRMMARHAANQACSAFFSTSTTRSASSLSGGSSPQGTLRWALCNMPTSTICFYTFLHVFLSLPACQAVLRAARCGMTHMRTLKVCERAHTPSVDHVHTRGGMVFTEGCPGVNNKASPPGRHQEQAPTALHF